MDHFYEQVVIKKNKTLLEILYFLSNVLMFVFGVFGLFALQTVLFAFSVQSLIIGVILIGLALLLFFKKGTLRTEYEYTFTNGELDFAKVFNNIKRKTLGTMKVKNVESFGKVNSNYFNKIINSKDIKTVNWFLNRDTELYYFYYIKEGKKNMVVFEPDNEMVELIKKYLPFGIFNG